jgi:hypothetical protein
VVAMRSSAYPWMALEAASPVLVIMAASIWPMAMMPAASWVWEVEG